MGSIARILAFLGIALAMAACLGPQERYAQVPGATWSYDAPQAFQFEVKESGEYSFFVNIQYLEDFDYANLWMNVEFAGPGMKPERLLLNNLLATNQGDFPGGDWDLRLPDGRRREGEWRLGAIGQLHERSYTLPALVNRRLSPGVYTIKLQHAMRDNKVTGIYKVGVRMKPAAN